MDKNTTPRTDSACGAGMSFPAAAEPAPALTRERMLADADALLNEFAADYRRMAE